MRPSAALLALVLTAIPGAAAAQTTRAAVLEQQRAEKAARLEPYEPGRIEKIVLAAEEGRLRRLISPHNGFFVQYDYSHKPTGSGMGASGGFRHDLFERRARLELEAGVSLKNYQLLRADFSLPRLLNERLELGVEGIHRYHPQDDFYGRGMSSRVEDRVSYLFEGNEIQGRAIVMPRNWLRVGTRAGHLTGSVASGKDSNYPSIEDLFDENDAPGLFEQPDYLYSDLFAEVDYRDEPGNARSGGNYRISWRRYSDQDLDRYSFQSLDVLVQQFVPVWDKKRVFAFQLALIGTNRADGNLQVPFYMQPTVGGSRTLRSVQDYRFRDTHAMWMNFEYRWEAFGLLDMALFTDWGMVSPRFSDLAISRLERGYGIGFRFNTAQTVFLRFDIGTGAGEGIRYFFKFSRMF